LERDRRGGPLFLGRCVRCAQTLRRIWANCASTAVYPDSVTRPTDL